MKKRLYVVTGAMGHLGNTVVKSLLARGCRVRGFVLPSDRTGALEGTGAELIYGDIRRREDLVPLFQTEPCEELTVIHTAGIVSISSKFRQEVYDVNVTGARHVLELCQRYQAAKLVHVSSVHAIPELPQGKTMTEVSSFSKEWVHGLYAQTKAEATQLVLDQAAKGLNASVVHPSGIIGPGDYGAGHLTQLISDYCNGRLTAYIRGGYDFVDVRDVSDGILSCMEQGLAGESYILSNRYYTIGELLEELHRITGRKMLKTVLPSWFARLTAPLSECYYRLRRQPPLYTSYSISALSGNASFSHAKADRELGYHTRPLYDTLADTVKFLSGQKRISADG